MYEPFVQTNEKDVPAIVNAWPVEQESPTKKNKWSWNNCNIRYLRPLVGPEMKKIYLDAVWTVFSAYTPPINGLEIVKIERTEMSHLVQMTTTICVQYGQLLVQVSTVMVSILRIQGKY